MSVSVRERERGRKGERERENGNDITCYVISLDVTIVGERERLRVAENILSREKTEDGSGDDV